MPPFDRATRFYFIINGVTYSLPVKMKVYKNILWRHTFIMLIVVNILQNSDLLNMNLNIHILE